MDKDDLPDGILLRDIWPIENRTDYKIHFGRWNKSEQPLDAWVNGDWQYWQEYYPGRNDFNRKFIFSLMDFYHEEDTWLFGGVFEVTARHLGERYEVALAEIGTSFIGRLKLHCPYRGRTTRVNLENHFDTFRVSEILREPYTGRQFPGYESIHLSFGELESIVRNERADWKAALSSVKGVYLVTDRNTRKRYVGSAYAEKGEKGVWSRWHQYVGSGHGNNKGLKDLLRGKEDPMAYCRQFCFSLLEHRPMHTPDSEIIVRESFWKTILMSRGEDGLNWN